MSIYTPGHELNHLAEHYVLKPNGVSLSDFKKFQYDMTENLANFKDGHIEEIRYSQFVQLVEDGEIQTSSDNPIVMTGNLVEGTLGEGDIESKFRVLIPKGAEEAVADTLISKGLTVEIAEDDQGGWVYMILTSWFPIILFVAFWIFLMIGARMWTARSPSRTKRLTCCHWRYPLASE